jgi:predicted transcriptional regulator
MTLKEYLTQKNKQLAKTGGRLTQTEFGRMVGVSQAHIHRLCMGSIPSVQLMRRIETATGKKVRYADWPVDPENSHGTHG